ncbi:MAG TPA: tetratricopeptide repeat protein [Thermoplasmata archaeon]
MAATRRLAAIMFTDMVDFTASAQANEADALRLLQEEEELVRPLFKNHKGREIKSTGDGFLVEFESALHAAQCAIDIQERLHERNSRVGAPPIKLRVGVHLGDVEERGGDIFGDAVNIASRIEPLAFPGGVCISGPVFDQVRNKIPNQFVKLSPRALKNVQVPMDIYRMAFPWEAHEPAPARTSRTRLAVLPLVNISPDPKDEYFADGLTEELISALSRIRELRVIARTSVSQYKSGSKSVSQIGAELDVASILEGSVRKAGNRLRITLQLIDARTQEHVWAHSYDRELDDVFAIQTEIAERTAGVLRLELLGAERESLRRKPTSNLAAYNLYLKGIHAARQTTYSGYAESIKYLDEAVKLDPDFSLAYSSQANMYLLLAGETLAPSEAFPRARKLLDRALELDPNSSEAHTARGNLALQHEQDWENSELEFRQAIALNPSNANAHFWYAMLLLVVKRFDEAEEELRMTIELDPLWGLPRVWLMEVYFAAGDVVAAIVAAEEERDRDPTSPRPHITLGNIYARAGRMEEARKEAELSMTGPVSETDRLDRAALRAILGEAAEARQLIGQWEDASPTKYVNPTWMAALYAALGEKETALECLERDSREGGRGSLWFSFNYQGLAFDSIRADAAFRSLLERLNLPTDGEGRAQQPSHETQ